MGRNKSATFLEIIFGILGGNSFKITAFSLSETWDIDFEYCIGKNKSKTVAKMSNLPSNFRSTILESAKGGLSATWMYRLFRSGLVNQLHLVGFAQTHATKTKQTLLP